MRLFNEEDLQANMNEAVNMFIDFLAEEKFLSESALQDELKTKYKIILYKKNMFSAWWEKWCYPNREDDRLKMHIIKIVK